MGCSSGSSQPTSSTVYNTNLPTYLQGPAEQLAGEAGALTSTTQNPYQSYIGNAAAGGQGIQGTTVAGLTPLQQQAMQGVQQMNVSPQTSQATGMAGTVGMNATDPNAYASNIQSYMSPYTQTLQNQAISNYAQSLPQLGSVATQAGGLGGSREALVQSQAQQGLQQNLANIQANAFQNAQNEYNAQQQMGLGAAQTMGNLGNQQYQQQLGILNAQNELGTQQQDVSQAVNNALNQNFQNYVNYPYAQEAFMSGILHGTSPGALGQQQSSSQYLGTPSTAATIAGAGTAAAGLGQLASAMG